MEEGTSHVRTYVRTSAVPASEAWKLKKVFSSSEGRGGGAGSFQACIWRRPRAHGTRTACLPQRPLGTSQCRIQPAIWSVRTKGTDGRRQASRAREQSSTTTHTPRQIASIITFTPVAHLRAPSSHRRRGCAGSSQLRRGQSVCPRGLLSGPRRARRRPTLLLHSTQPRCAPGARYPSPRGGESPQRHPRRIPRSRIHTHRTSADAT